MFRKILFATNLSDASERALDCVATASPAFRPVRDEPDVRELLVQYGVR